MKRSDPEADDGVLSQERLMCYTPGWQLIEEDVDDDFDDASADRRHVQYVWGSRYIDDIILRREDRSDGTGTLPDGDRGSCRTRRPAPTSSSRTAPGS